MRIYIYAFICMLCIYIYTPVYDNEKKNNKNDNTNNDDNINEK